MIGTFNLALETGTVLRAIDEDEYATEYGMSKVRFLVFVLYLSVSLQQSDPVIESKKSYRV